MPGRVPHRRRQFNIFGFIGMVVFLCGMILAVGTFLYKGYNVRALESKKAELRALKNSFSEDDIMALRKLDHRINAARKLLDAHLAPSVVFDALELRTQKDAMFSDFSYEKRESGSVEITLEGTALRFNTVALQSQQLADAEVFARTVFSGLSIDEEGRVGFTVTGEGNTAALAYAAPAALPEEPEMATSTIPAATTTPPVPALPPATTSPPSQPPAL